MPNSIKKSWTVSITQGHKGLELLDFNASIYFVCLYSWTFGI